MYNFSESSKSRSLATPDIGCTASITSKTKKTGISFESRRLNSFATYIPVSVLRPSWSRDVESGMHSITPQPGAVATTRYGKRKSSRPTWNAVETVRNVASSDMVTLTNIVTRDEISHLLLSCVTLPKRVSPRLRLSLSTSAVFLKATTGFIDQIRTLLPMRRAICSIPPTSDKGEELLFMLLQASYNVFRRMLLFT